MIPIRDDNPQLMTPGITFGIVALNALVWIAVQGFGTEPALARSVCTLGLVPGELLGRLPPGVSVQISRSAMCVITGAPNFGSLVSHMFLHGGWLHLIGNMWFLWIFGGNVEDAMGHGRFFLFYLLCGLAAAGLQILFSPASGIPMVGASGAIGGVMGAYVVLYPRVNVHLLLFLGFYATTVVVPAVWMLGYWFVLQALGGVFSLGGQGGGVAFWAHVGGFLAGAVLTRWFRNPRLLALHPHHGWERRSSRPYRRLR